MREIYKKETNMTTIKNFTPHEITFILEGGTTVTFPPQGEPIRLEMEAKETISAGDFPCVANFVMGHNLPPEEEGVYLLVSSMILAAFPNRLDLVAPDTGPTATRNEKGHIVGVCRFVRN